MDASPTFNAAYFRSRGWWRDETLADWLDKVASERPDQPAVMASGGNLTYGDLAERVRTFASALQRLNIQRGDVVAVQLPNIPEFLIGWLAINRLGAVMQTVHMPYGPREVEHLLRHSGAKLCIALSRAKDQQPARNVDALRPRLANLHTVISVGEKFSAIGNFAEMMDQASGTAFEPPPVSGNDHFLQLYTSGTTSAPKAVAVTYNHFLSNARLCAAEFGVRSEDRIICLAPFTHLYGLYVLKLGFSAGATA